MILALAFFARNFCKCFKYKMGFNLTKHFYYKNTKMFIGAILWPDTESYVTDFPINFSCNSVRMKFCCNYMRFTMIFIVDRRKWKFQRNKTRWEFHSAIGNGRIWIGTYCAALWIKILFLQRRLLKITGKISPNVSTLNCRNIKFD